MLRIIGVKDPWGNMESVAHRVGLGIPDLRGAFTRAAQRRHAAAHEAGADTQPVDLQNYTREALAIAISFDLLMSRANCLLQYGRVPEYEDFRSQASLNLRLRFLDKSRNKWREVPEGRRRAYRVKETLQDLRLESASRARANGEAIVIRDEAGVPQDWLSLP